MKARRVTILRKGLLVLALPLIYQALFIGLLLKRQADLDNTQHWAIHSKDVIEKTEYIFRLLVNEQSNLRGYLLTGAETFTADMARDEVLLDEQFVELKRMVQDNPDQQSRLDQILTLARERRDFQHAIEAKMKAEGMERAQEEMRNLHGKEIMDKLRGVVEEFRAAEEKITEERMQKLSDATRLQNWLLVVGLVVNVGIGAMAAVMFSKEIGERIVVLTQNTRRITSGEALPPLVPGTDEIRELDEHFHALADNLKTSRVREQVYQDALERRANELTRANRELEQKSQENEMFVYSVSHDLRSPLVNLQGFSKELGLTREDLLVLLQKDLSESDRKRAITLTDRDMSESIHFIQTAVTRLSSIIDALLRLSRAGRVEYHPKLVDLNPVVHRIVEAMRVTINARGAEISVGDLAPVWADPTAIEQIFANLIGNAVNYLDPQRPGRVEIGTTTRDVEGVEKPLTYFVKDNGLGIAESYLPKVFAIFQRLHGNVAAGEGVGLALVKRVVERHGGKVWVESVEGVGSTFFVAFPAELKYSPLPGVAPRKERLNVPVPQS